MSGPRLITARDVSEFRESGVLILRSFYNLRRDIRPIQEDIYRIIGQVLTRHTVTDTRRPYTSEEFDDGYVELIARNRSYGGEVYDAVKQIPAFMRLVANPKHELLFRELRSDSIPGIAAGGYGIRIDNPNEERFRAPW